MGGASGRPMSPPLFSVVIPTFNRSALLRYAVQSLLRQSFRDLEIVISNNSSTDDTADVARAFTDPRVRYVQTPRNLVTVDSFEFARRAARGKLVIVLNDDDVLVETALERFRHEHEAHGADFIFSKAAEYCDRNFPGPGKNTLECPPFQGGAAVISADDFIRPAFRWRQQHVWHPSAFVFSRELADGIARRCGRLFQSNGVEYCAWPLAAMFARRIVHVDAPLAICGRTGQSWGSNMIMGRIRKARIQKFIRDYYVDQRFKCTPLTNFTMCNLQAEGYLTAKRLFPSEFADYELDEQRYLMYSMKELSEREARGVDVTAAMEELRRYVARAHPDFLERINDTHAMARQSSWWAQLRGAIGDIGLGDGVTGSRNPGWRGRRPCRARPRSEAATLVRGSTSPAQTSAFTISWSALTSSNASSPRTAAEERRLRQGGARIDAVSRRA